MSRVVTVTGTSGVVTDPQWGALARNLRGATRLRHGVCVGADQAAHVVALGLGIPISGHPGVDRSGNPKKRAKIRASSFDEFEDEIWFLNRNAVMVERSDEVLGVVTAPTFYRSGEWQTLKKAIALGRPCLLLLPDGSEVAA